MPIVRYYKIEILRKDNGPLWNNGQSVAVPNRPFRNIDYSVIESINIKE